MARLKPGPDPAPPMPRYINREASWLQFNRRVLAEAENPANPLLERLKFLAIFESNLDEFYMVRVSGLSEQFESGIEEPTPDGLTPRAQLEQIGMAALPMRRHAGSLLADTLAPAMDRAGIQILRCSDLDATQQTEMEARFVREIFPVCTPLLLHPSTSPPFLSNRSLNLAVELRDRGAEPRLARVKIPSVLPRAIRIHPRRDDFVLIEDVIGRHLAYLFPGVEVLGCHAFRVLRDADLEIRELEAADLITAVEEMTRKRRFGAPIRIDTSPDMPSRVRDRLLGILELDATDVFPLDGPLGLDFLWELTALDRPDLKFPVHTPYLDERLPNAEALFQWIAGRDLILHQPYDSFRPIEDFVASAAQDPAVIGIKQTLYRVGAESPIVESLLQAAEGGKQVAVMVELKARFDEANNLVWARALERAGAHVSYGFSELKTHCKLCLVVRREREGIRTYAHVGTGNYNPATARVYTDLGLFTSDPDIAQDVAELFNFLTGFSRQAEYRRLLVAPVNLREGIIARIEREIEEHRASGGGRIVFKLNSLVDPEVIDALYEASEAGVRIDLIVRGICCLRPGVRGLSRNIRVVSIVGRFLEHSRAYYFGNGGQPELYLGSADLMRRNLDRRIEVLVPILDPDLIPVLQAELLDVCLQDDARAWELTPEGAYRRLARSDGNTPFDSQEWMIAHPTSQAFFRRIEAESPISKPRQGKSRKRPNR